MRKLPALLATLALLLFYSTTFAEVIDAPHNSSNDIKCGGCHAFSLWWQYSPAASDNNYNTIAEDVCFKCHGPGGSAFNKKSHAYSSMEEMHNPLTDNWSTKCIDCHDPHIQPQLSWLTGSESGIHDIFLVNAVVEANPNDINDPVPYDSFNNTSEIFYNSADAKANWTDPAIWGIKTAGDRGLILVVSLTDQERTFEVFSAMESTPIVQGTANGTGSITVQGEVDPAIVGSDFGLIYGQLIKQYITTPNGQNRAVQFFDPSNTDSQYIGAFIDQVSGSSPVGICQVCHTKADYWLQDGTVVNTNNFGGSPPTDHNSGAVCTGCHDTSLGFKPSNADHTFISATGTTCASCHVEADIATGVHKAMCSHCHDGSPPALVGSISGKWPTPDGQNRLTGNCTDCHLAITAKFTDHPNAADHTTINQVTASANCTIVCHFHNNKDIITQVHGTDGSPCDQCHNLSYNQTTGEYTGSGALISYATAGPGDCENCHTNISANWQAHPSGYTHVGQVDGAGASLCTRCHTGHEINIVHKFDCGSCHEGANGELKSLAKSKGPGNCMNCHGTNFFIHTISNFSTYDHVAYGAVTADPACTVCHVEPNMVTGIHSTLGCSTCHTSTGHLVGSISGNYGHSINESGNPPNTCSTCHTDKQSHPADTDHLALGFTTNVDRCVSCHGGFVTTHIHNADVQNDCQQCHTSLRTDMIRTLQPGIVVGGDCISCHNSYNSTNQANVVNSFYSHPLDTDHTGQVGADDPSPSVRSCEQCHLNDPEFPNPVWDVHVTYSCATCHTESGPLDGVLIGSASGKGTGKPPVGDNYCVDCHSAASYQNPDLHNLVTP